MKKNSLLARLRAYVFIPFVVFIVFIFSILHFQYRRSAVRELKEQIRYEDNIVSGSLETRITNAQNSVNIIILQLNSLMKDTLTDNGGPVISARTRRLVYRCMLNTFATYANAEQIMVLWNNGVSWYENWTENYSMQSGQEELLAELREKGITRAGRWMTGLDTESAIGRSGPFYVKQYVDINTLEPVGYIIFKPDDLFEAIEQKSRTEKEIYLFSPEGILMASSDEAENTTAKVLARLDVMKEDTGNQVNELTSWRQWKMVSVTDMKEATKDLNRTITTIIIISLLISLVVFLFLNHFIERLLMPIRKLSEHMVEMPDELPSAIDMPVSDDEVGVLVSHFNEMAESNHKLVDTLMEEKHKQEHLKFQLLQSQIKPHFLYNSLDTIYCLSMMEQNEKASDMTKLLSDYYRHVLSKGMDWVLLFEEVQQTENYLKIQSIRYKDLLDYEIVVNENVENIRIPKLTLQPLVENAIYHGIKPLGRKGKLELRINESDWSMDDHSSEKCIEIRVIDDGTGMTLAQFETEVATEHEEENGFGLRNVAERLKFYYNDHCTVSLEEREKGTCILIRIFAEPEVG